MFVMPPDSDRKGAGESWPSVCTPVYLADVSDRLLESVPCNICGSLEAHVLQPAQYDIDALQDTDFARTFSSSSDERLNHQLVACAHCGLQYVSPRLRAESVLKGYAAGSDEQFVSQAKGRELTFTRSLEVIEDVWDGPPGRLLDIGTGAASRITGCASGRGKTTACTFVRAPSSINTILLNHSRSSPSGTCSNIRPIRKPRCVRRIGC